VVGGDGPLPNRLLHFQWTVLEGCLLATVSLTAAWVQRIDLFPAQIPPLAAWVAGVAACAAAVVFMRPQWRRAVERKTHVVHLFMPSNNAERAWWITVAMVAGIGEEITWRGVQLALVGALTGSYWPAALLCAISFGMAPQPQFPEVAQS
jgi:divalent metal cation (Fe/Co/Zn/Cd) transporter